jgi:hypothetical protein
LVVAFVDLDCGQGQKCVVAEKLWGGWRARELFGDFQGHFLEQFFGGFEVETVGVDFVFGEAVDSEVELAQLVQKGFEQVPGHDWVEVHLVDFMRENRVVVFPTFFNTQQKVLYSIRVLQPIKPRPVNQFIIQRLCTHIVFNFKLFFNQIKLGKPVWELDPLIDFIKIVVVETVDVEGLGFGRLLVFDCLLQFVE